MKKLIITTAFALFSILITAQTRYIVIGAHPDDCELIVGGTATKLIEAGHKVKFVSLTNGNKGHHQYTSEEIEKIRAKEVETVKQRLGCEYEVVGEQDGELLPTLANRNKVIRIIREWNADVVITHPPYDYHPDHRSTSTLVQDAAFMVTVPLALPSIPALKKNPVFLYMIGRLQNPTISQPPISIDITSVVEKKAYIVDAHASQLYEWLPWINNDSTPIPESKEGRLKYTIDYISNRDAVNTYTLPTLEKWYGKKQADKIKSAESFEVCPFGKKVTEQELRNLLPF